MSFPPAAGGAPAFPAINFDNTVGATLVAGLITTTLFGITILQTFNYYQKFGNDPRQLKVFVAFIWLMDTAHVVLVSHSLYWYMVKNFANPFAIFLIPKSLAAGICLTNISDFAVCLFFARRVYVLSQKNKILAGPLVVSVFLALIFGLWFGIKTFSFASFADLKPFLWLMYTGFAWTVFSDLYIAITLCLLLYSSGTRVKRTKSVVNVLMVYAINTGLICSITAAVSLVFYLALPTTYIFLIPYFPLSKLYVNAMLATLNAREALRLTWQHHGATGGIVSSLVAYMPDASESATDSSRTNTTPQDSKNAASRQLTTLSFRARTQLSSSESLGGIHGERDEIDLGKLEPNNLDAYIIPVPARLSSSQ